MSTSPQLERHDLRASLLELVQMCPVDRCNPDECPLFEFRNLKPEERLRWFDALPDTDLEYLSLYHHVCMNLRIQAGNAA